jgi:hypothetical protein
MCHCRATTAAEMIGWSEVAEDLTAGHEPSEVEPTTDPEAPPGTEPGQPNSIPSLTQLADLWSAPEALQQLRARPEAPAAVPEALEVESKALDKPLAAPETFQAAPAAAAGTLQAEPAPVPAPVPETPAAAAAGTLQAEPAPVPAPVPETPAAAAAGTLQAEPAPAAAAAAGAPRAAFAEMGDRWLEWFLPVMAIVLPAFFLILIPFIQNNIWTWGKVDLSSQRGDYLIPVLILCAETVRRWCREVNCRGLLLRRARFAAVSICATALLVCFASAVAASEFNATSTSGRSIDTITVWCLIPSFVFGTFAVVAPHKERDK